MNNFERFEERLREGDFTGAALLAIEFAGRCGSKANAWAWAERAVEAAAQAGVKLHPGGGRWPDLQGMEERLAGR